MHIKKPTYLIAELSGDIASLVYGLRQKFNPDRVKWPVDITIVGSSGVGTFKEGQSLEKIVNTINPIIGKFSSSHIRFTEVGCFPGTGIYYLAPEREALDILHQNLTRTDIEFNDNAWPFNPHCTLRAGLQPTAGCDSLFETLNIPKSSYIECFSIYQPEPNGGKRLHRF